MRPASIGAMLAVALTVAGARVDAQSCGGIWSASGKLPHVGDAYTADAIASPNKENVLTLSEETIEFRHGSGKPIALQVPINTALMEVIWAPTSDAFAINVSDADNSGPWQTYIFRIEPGKDEPTPVSLDGEIRNSPATRCEGKVANIAVVSWSENGKTISLVTEVPPVDRCLNKSELAGFRVSAADGKIIERISSSTVTQTWNKELGCRLKRG